MTPDEQRRLAVLEAQMKDTRDDIHEIKTDVKMILGTIASAKGGWRMILLVAGIAGTLGAFASKLGAFLGLAKP